MSYRDHPSNARRGLRATLARAGWAVCAALALLAASGLGFVVPERRA